MMEGKRLLERIREMSRNPHWRGNVDPISLQESILRHLQSILNTRQGSAIIAQDFGIPDFSMISGNFDHSEISLMEKGILNVVSRYERRLKNITITFKQDPTEPLQMFFILQGQLVGTSEEVPVTFETVLNTNGRFTIRKPS